MAETKSRRMMMALIALFAGAGIFAAIHFSPESRALRSCETIIKSQLLAPLSYHRVSHDYFSAGSQTQLLLTYDANNAFGTSLRRKGVCRPDATGQFEWSEY